jgi:uncharacterized membrane protein YfcA
LLDAVELLIAGAAFLAGAVVLTTVGFGLGMTATPPLLLFLDPQTVVVSVNTVILALFGLVIYRNRAGIPLRQIAPMTVAGLLGVPIGVWALSSLDAGVLRVAITALILLITLTLVFRVRLPASRERALGLGLAFVVGAMLVTLGIGGPLMVLLFLSRGWSSQAIRLSLAMYFFLVNLAAVVGYGVAGLYTSDTLLVILVATVPALVGFKVGLALVGRMDERAFRKVTLSVIAVTSLMVLGRELLGLQGAV